MDCCKTKEKEECCGDLKKSSFLAESDKKSNVEESKELKLKPTSLANNSIIGKQLKGGSKKMNTRVILWVVIGALFVVALFLTFKAGAAGSVEAAQTAGSAVASSAPSYSGMVG